MTATSRCGRGKVQQSFARSSSGARIRQSRGQCPPEFLLCPRMIPLPPSLHSARRKTDFEGGSQHRKKTHRESETKAQQRRFCVPEYYIPPVVLNQSI